MKSRSWLNLKKLCHIYLLNLALLVTQLTAIGGVLPSRAFSESKVPTKSNIKDDDWMPPGFTADDFRTVEQTNIQAQKNRLREDDRNVGKVQIEHDISSSSCRTKSANNERRMNDIVKYRSVVGAQGFDEICRLRQKLQSQTGGPPVTCGQGLALLGNTSAINRDGSLQGAEGKYSDNPGGASDHIDAEKMEEKRLKLKDQMDSDKATVEKLRKRVPLERQAYEAAEQRCQDYRMGCTGEQRKELYRIRNIYYSSVAGLEKAEKSYKSSKKNYENIGKPLMSERGAIKNSGDDVIGNKEQMRESDALSTAGEGANGALSGPVHETNEQLKDSIDRYTANAASFAEEKIAETARLEFAKQNSGDYEFYELALKDIDNSTNGGAQALSNLDVMAMTSAATKKVKCEPKRRHDSKAYHIFRAASATYIAAAIGDQASYTEHKSCIGDEVFNEENKDNDSQFELVEKALNSHTQMVDSMCLTVAPDPNNIPEVGGEPILSRDLVERLKKICDASAGVTCAPGQEEGCAPRSKQSALDMFEAAQMIALQETIDKRQLVATAEANVKKGKKKIKTTIRNILVTTALYMVHGMLSISFFAIGMSLMASICHCGQSQLSKAAYHAKEKVIFYGLFVYFGLELIKWRNFTKKWERKLDEAREHTHLACNFDEAKASEQNQVDYATNTKAKAKEAFEKAQEKIRNQINQLGVGALGGKTGFVMPKNLPPELRSYAVKTYLTKYFKAFGKSAFDLVFPVAMATADLDTESNTETATLSGGGTVRSANALGMAIGSSSFYQFVIKQNQDWQVQAFDASINSGSGYRLTDNPVLYCNDESADQDSCIKEFMEGSDFAGGKYRQSSTTMPIAGMPTPETRYMYMKSAYELVNENINGTLAHLQQAVEQRDKYVMLINNMRTQMNVKDQGNSMQLQPKIAQKAVSCMKEGIGGTLEIDATCQCQKTNTCGKLQYPDLGEFSPGVLSDSEKSIKGLTDKALSGKLDKANVESGNLSGNKSAVRKRIATSLKILDKAREDAGKSPLNYNKRAKNIIEIGRKQAFKKYANLFPANVKQEKTRGGLAAYYNDMNLGTKDKGSSSNQPALAAVGDTNGKKGLAAGLDSGSSASSENNKDLFNFDFEFGDDESKLTAAQRKALEDQRALAALEAKNRKDSSSARYQHQRDLSLSDEGNSENNGINKDTKKNIFTIISSRYKKSAFPIFLKEQFIR